MTEQEDVRRITVEFDDNRALRTYYQDRMIAQMGKEEVVALIERGDLPDPASDPVAFWEAITARWQEALTQRWAERKDAEDERIADQ
jgi:hypothetical protein